MNSRYSLSVIAASVALLVTTATISGHLDAQVVKGKLLDQLAPYVGKEITVTEKEDVKVQLQVTLVEIGIDYISVQSHKEYDYLVPLSAIKTIKIDKSRTAHIRVHVVL